MRALAIRFAAIAALPCLCFAQDARDRLREQVLRVAQHYATFEWRASETNVLHGDDADGVRVDTPDRTFDVAGWLADGTANRGMPYAWGGFTSVEEFTAGLKQGRFAGLVPASEQARASQFALGVDCSGYVSRCLDLPVKQTTRSLATLCYPLDGYEALQPGDLLNQHDSHVALFVAWSDATRQQMRVLEAARLGVTESVYDAETARRTGFRPLRYRLLDQRWKLMDEKSLGKPSWRRPAAASTTRFVATSASVPAEADDHPLEQAVVGTWVSYSVTAGARAVEATTRTLFAAAEDDELELQCVEIIDGKLLPTGRRTARNQAAPQSLVDLLAFYEPLEVQRVVAHEVEAGTCTHGHRKFAARRHTWRLEGRTVVRHQEYPLWLDVTAVFAEDVPLYRVVTAEFELAVDWRLSGRRSDATRLGLALSLDAFGSAP